MLLRMSLIASSLLLLASCMRTDEPVVVSQPQIIERNIPIQPRPRGVELLDINWRVINHENIDEFLNEISVGEEFVFMVLSVRDYENLALNVDELRRYVTQQRDIIIYYEESIKQ